MKTAEQLIDEAYDKLFDEICKIHDDLCELMIEYQETSTGKKISRSWKERNKILREEELEKRKLL